ncbi:MAG: MauE/DoxX family redox-associated membrane protein [Ktedonobacteraceae bacterium]
MAFPLDIPSMRLGIRILVGVVLLSVGVSKLMHPRRFRQAIQEYYILPSALDGRFAGSALFAFAIPLAELSAGLGLITGMWLIPSLFVALSLFVLFSGAILINLRRGRTDLSCHCAGVLGSHRISWWLLGRNAFFIAGLLVLLLTPPDRMTLDVFVHRPSLLSSLFLSTILPVVSLVGVVLAVLVLLSSAKVLFRP